MVGWHHQLNGLEFEQTSGDGDGQGSLACCSLWGHKEMNTTATELNSTGQHVLVYIYFTLWIMIPYCVIYFVCQSVPTSAI